MAHCPAGRNLLCDQPVDDDLDLADGRRLFTVEHEVRSATHPMYLRPLVNRNPAQTNRTYAHGHELTPWAMEVEPY